jgi:hypothetical protein
MMMVMGHGCKRGTACGGQGKRGGRVLRDEEDQSLLGVRVFEKGRERKE